MNFRSLICHTDVTLNDWSGIEWRIQVETKFDARPALMLHPKIPGWRSKDSDQNWSYDEWIMNHVDLYALMNSKMSRRIAYPPTVLSVSIMSSSSILSRRCWPTWGLSTTTGIPQSCRWFAGPIPLRINRAGDSRAPPATITESAR